MYIYIYMYTPAEIRFSISAGVDTGVAAGGMSRPPRYSMKHRSAPKEKRP